jgi:hypothetical protein
MKAQLRCGAAALALIASVGLASAQTVVTTREAIELSPAQRTTVYRTITRETRTIDAQPGFDVTVGARVPRSVEIHTMPETVITEVPVVKRYRYMVVNNQVVLVDPDTSEVVEIIRQ